jgi:hypothetical protein
MEKQTAVEWLREQFHKVPQSQFGNLFEQAKQMEKEQIMEAYWDGGQDIAWTNKICEQYYNKTYNNESTNT